MADELSVTTFSKEANDSIRELERPLAALRPYMRKTNDWKPGNTEFQPGEYDKSVSGNISGAMHVLGTLIADVNNPGSTQAALDITDGDKRSLLLVAIAWLLPEPAAALEGEYANKRREIFATRKRGYAIHTYYNLAGESKKIILPLELLAAELLRADANDTTQTRPLMNRMNFARFSPLWKPGFQDLGQSPQAPAKAPPIATPVAKPAPSPTPTPDLQAELSAVRAEALAASQRAKEAAGALDAAVARTAILEQNIKTLEEALAAERLLSQTNQKSADEAAATFAAAVAQIATLEQNLQAQQEAHAAEKLLSQTNQKSADQAAAESRIAVLEQNVLTLQAELDASQLREKELLQNALSAAQLLNTLQEIEKLLQDANRQTAELIAAHSSAQQQQAERIRYLEGQLAESSAARSELATAKQELQTLQETLAESNKQIVLLQNTNAALEAELFKLKKRPAQQGDFTGRIRPGRTIDSANFMAQLSSIRKKVYLIPAQGPECGIINGWLNSIDVMTQYNPNAMQTNEHYRAEVLVALAWLLKWDEKLENNNGGPFENLWRDIMTVRKMNSGLDNAYLRITGDGTTPDSLSIQDGLLEIKKAAIEAETASPKSQPLYVRVAGIKTQFMATPASFAMAKSS